MIFGNIIFNENIEPIFNNMNLNLISNNIIKSYSSSSLLLNSNSSYKLFLQTNKHCSKSTTINYGGDIIY